jgi:hypothetical protein
MAEEPMGEVPGRPMPDGEPVEGSVPLRSLKDEIEDIADGVSGTRRVGAWVRVQRDSGLVSPGPSPARTQPDSGLSSATPLEDAGSASG